MQFLVFFGNGSTNFDKSQELIEFCVEMNLTGAILMNTGLQFNELLEMHFNKYCILMNNPVVCSSSGNFKLLLNEC